MKIFKAESYTDNGIYIFKSGGKAEGEHMHNFLEIIYVLRGSAKEWIGEKEYVVKRGDVLFISPDEIHSFTPSDSNFSYYNVILKPELADRYIYNREDAFERLLKKETSTDIIHFFRERDSLESLLENMLNECKMKDFGYFNALCGYTNVLLTKMQRKLSLLQEEKEDVWSKVMNYIDENLDAKLTITDVAEKFYYNPSYFSRIFPQKTGLMFSEYIANRRLKKAARLLTETDIAVDKIATLCGFADRSTFYRNFRKKYAVSPALYRKS